MSADLLRRAGTALRERAEAATDGPWRALCDGYGDTSGGTGEGQRRDLALLAADLLDALANDREQDPFLPKPFDEHAIAFARTVLGEEATP